MGRLFHVLSYLKNYKGLAALNVIFNLLSAIFSLFSITLVIPFLNLIFLTESDEYERIVAAGEPTFSWTVKSGVDMFSYHFGSVIMQDGKQSALIFLCFLIIGTFLLKNLFRYLAMYFIATVRVGIVRDLRQRTYNKLVTLPLGFFSEEKKGDLMARISSDVQEIEWTILRSLEMIFRDPITIVIFLVAMLIMNVKLTLFIFVLLPVTGFIIGRIGKSLKRKSLRGQNQLGLLMSWIEETLSGMRIIKAFNAQQFSRNRFAEINEGFRKLLLAMYRRKDLASPMSEFLGVAVVVVVMWFGGNMVLGDEMGASKFIGFIVFFSQILTPAKSFTNAYYNVQKGAASAERLEQILNEKDTIADAPNAVGLSGFNESILYENVSFRYGEVDVLKDIDLEIRKGETVALVGPSGSGKSTLADLLPRFYDALDGSISIDGKDVRSLKVKDLRSQMGIVNQDSILFNDSVFNNIAFGTESATEEQVKEAARIAHADEFVSEMPEGYETNIGDMGQKLSGGQRQRLSIARAILKNPPILILDEATSALDTESEKIVQEALDRLMQNRTSLVIAHRLSTVQSADKIIVLDEGRIVQTGTHDQLYGEQGGLYRKLCDLQNLS